MIEYDLFIHTFVDLLACIVLSSLFFFKHFEFCTFLSPSESIVLGAVPSCWKTAILQYCICVNINVAGLIKEQEVILTFADFRTWA